MHTQALRFLTAGSVDDGKSTLIGRLLFDSQAILADQIDALEKRAAGQPRAAGEPRFDLSLLTDGLEAEREQGITIDVAFRYFATRQRKFIIADAPGHEQYTRNMVTAAAGSDAAVVLVDVTKLDWRARPVALLPQTRRHALLAQLLRVPSIVFAINKLDAVDRARRGLRCGARGARTLCRRVGHARRRDRSGVRPARRQRHARPGRALVRWPLAAAGARGSADRAGVRTTARWRCRCSTWPDRTKARARASACSGAASRRARCARAMRCRCSRAASAPPWSRCAAPAAGSNAPRPAKAPAWCSTASSTSRAATGSAARQPAPTQRFSATWPGSTTSLPPSAASTWLRHGNRWVQGRIASIEHVLDIHTLVPGVAHQLTTNEIGRVTVELQQPLPLQRLCRQPRRRRADRGRPGQPPHQRRAAGGKVAAA